MLDRTAIGECSHHPKALRCLENGLIWCANCGALSRRDGGRVWTGIPMDGPSPEAPNWMRPWLITGKQGG